MMLRGISIVELMIALTVMTITMTAVVVVVVNAPIIIADARASANAVQTARNKLQSNLSSLTLVQFEEESFSHRIARVAWSSVRGAQHSKELTEVVSTNTEPVACDPFTSGDWSKPNLIKTYAFDSTELLTSRSGTYTISALAITPSALLVTTSSTSLATSSNLFFFSLVGTSTPKLIASFDNASTSRIGNSSIAAYGSYSYIGNAFGSASAITCADRTSCAQVNAYSSSPQPRIISSLTLSTSSLPFAYLADGSTAPTSALALYHNVLYLGLQKTVHGDEFNIIDASDPQHLRWIAGYPIGRTVNSITVRGMYAYLSTDDPSRELMIFDVSDPSHPVLRATWDAPGSPTFGYGAASSIYQDYIRFGRTYTSTSQEFELLQFSSSTSISELEHIDNGTTRDPESVRALLTQDRTTFMLLTHQLDVLDTHDPKHARILGTYSFPTNSKGVALACRNNELYLARNRSDGSGIIDILQAL